MGFGKGMHNLNPAGALLSGNYTEGAGLYGLADDLRPEFRTRERTLVVIAGDGLGYNGFAVTASFDDGALYQSIFDVWGNEFTGFGAHGGYIVLGADYPLLKVQADGGDVTSNFKVLIV